MGRSRFAYLCALLILLCVPALTIYARAGADLYLETGIGAGQIYKAQKIYGAQAKNLQPGFSGNALFAASLGPDNSVAQFHLGVETRLTTTSGSGNSYWLSGIYPIFRVETRRFYVGGGASPFLFQRAGKSSTLVMQQLNGTLGFLGEFGLLWRVVPFFNLALEFSLEYGKGKGAAAPAPAAQATLQMRFYIGDAIAPGNARKRKYDGWRYPFGMELF